MDASLATKADLVDVKNDLKLELSAVRGVTFRPISDSPTQAI
jgi:hypothetical protein